MSRKMADTFSSFSSSIKKADTSSLTSPTKKLDFSSLSKKADTTIFPKKADVSSLKKTDVSSLKRTDVSSISDAAKKMETDSFTKKYAKNITDSSFFKKNKGKLAALGFTTASLAGWYGTLRAQGLSHDEAMDNIKGGVEGAAGWATENIVEELIQTAWWALVVLVHNFAGKRVFDDQEKTSTAMKYFLGFLVAVRVLGIMGINVFSLIFSLIFGRKK